MAYGKSIELFLVNGTADSLIIAELSNWNGKAIKIPRIEVSSCDRDDITQAGVYFLFCKEDDGSDSVYIGEAENVKDRLVQHLRDYQSEKEKYYWSTAVVFIGRDLNKALIKESQVAVMEEFVDNVKILINALGYKVLEPFAQVDSSTATVDDELLFITSGSVNATGKVTAEGFVVFAGATVNEKMSVKSLSAGMQKQRQKLFDSSKVNDLVTTEDILFSSSSAAADFILGYSVSGPRTWKTKDGKSLKEIESNQT